MLRNIIGQIFSSTKRFFSLFSFFNCYKNRILPAERRRYLQQKKREKRRHFGQTFSSKKGNFWTDFQLYSIFCLYFSPYPLSLTSFHYLSLSLYPSLSRSFHNLSLLVPLPLSLSLSSLFFSSSLFFLLFSSFFLSLISSSLFVFPHFSLFLSLFSSPLSLSLPSFYCGETRMATRSRPLSFTGTSSGDALAALQEHMMLRTCWRGRFSQKTADFRRY